MKLVPKLEWFTKHELVDNYVYGNAAVLYVQLRT